VAQPERIAACLTACITALDTPNADNTLCQSTLFLHSPLYAHITCYVSARGTGSDVWKTTHELVKSLSEIMLSTIPNFWKIAKGYMDGKYKKVNQLFVFVDISLTCMYYLDWSPTFQKKSLAMSDNDLRHGSAIHSPVIRILFAFRYGGRYFKHKKRRLAGLSAYGKRFTYC
jgi:hypothetical protein